MNYADIKYCDVANGEGVRVSLFVSGCTHHCKECFNKEAWDFHYGNPFTQKEIDRILEYLNRIILPVCPCLAVSRWNLSIRRGFFHCFAW